MNDSAPASPAVPRKRVLNPLSDLFTRWLFGEEHHKALLTDFVNAVLVRKGEGMVKDLELKNPFNVRDAVQSKETILDVRARDSRGRAINLEVQLGQQPAYISRSLYYWSTVYHRQLEGGATYRKLEPVICINLLGFSLFPDLEEWHNCFHITEKDHPEYLLSDHLSIHFVEVYNKGERTEGALINLENELERWCYFFRNEGLMEESEMPEELKKDGTIWNAHKQYESFTADQELLALAEAREKWLKHYNTGMEAAREEGLEEGLKQGIEKGIEKGLEKGMEKGMEKAAREHALKMLRDGVPAEKAALYSGLPLVEVRGLVEK